MNAKQTTVMRYFRPKGGPQRVPFNQSQLSMWTKARERVNKMAEDGRIPKHDRFKVIVNMVCRMMEAKALRA